MGISFVFFSNLNDPKKEVIANKKYIVGNQVRPSILVSKNNQIIIYWNNYNKDSSEMDVYLDFFYFYQIANTTLASSQEKSSVIPLINGNFLIIWYCSKCESALYSRIDGQLFDFEGKKIGSEIKLNSDNNIHSVPVFPKAAVLSNKNIFNIIFNNCLHQCYFI